MLYPREPVETGPAPTSYLLTLDPVDPLAAAVDRQAAWVDKVTRAVDPQQWLFDQRARLRDEGACDPWAQQLLFRAGMLPSR